VKVVRVSLPPLWGLAMSHAYQALLLTGLPGSGKSTQGKVLGALPGLHYWSAGEVLRAVDSHSDHGRMVQRYLAHGELIPDELAVSLCLADLEARVAAGVYRPATDLLVLDGIPRTVRQAAVLDEHITVIKILSLVCNDIERLNQSIRDWHSWAHRDAAQLGLPTTDVYQCHVDRFSVQSHEVVLHRVAGELVRFDTLRAQSLARDRYLELCSW
jgi:adenylate kinase family enzyme